MLWKSISCAMAASLALAATCDASFASGNATRSLFATADETCTLQPGIDYEGNDLKGVAGATAADCCGKCQAMDGCKVYTWNDFNGGTCWLKSGRGKTQANSGATSGVVPARSEENTDYVGNDIGSTTASAAHDCHAKCQATNGCKAFTWTDWESGTCWFKSGRGEVRAATGVHSGEISEIRHIGDAEWKVELGVDYVGYDIASVGAKNSSDCETLCLAYSDCNAFTFSDWQSGTCWLKTVRGATQKTQENVVSAVLTPKASTPDQCVANQGQDYSGNDIGNVPAKAATDCCAVCQATKGCGAYTWTEWEGGRCWLKSSVGEVKENPSAVSGKVAVDVSKHHVQYKIRDGQIPSRAVNLGGWLVAEYWMSMTSPAWKDADGTGWGGEYIAMQKLGKEKGTKQFEEHRATWITEDDIKEIATNGLNMVRVPVGFWIVDDIPGVQPTDISSVYARGSLKYLDTLVHDWALKYNVGVYLSLHSHQGSQNGYDHSAPQEMGKQQWSASPNNVENSLRFAKILAARYKDAPAFVGLQLMNEPDKDTSREVRNQYYLEAYKQIRATGNNCIIGVSPHLTEQGSDHLRDFMRWPDYTNVWMEWHVYYKWGYEGQWEDQILGAVRNYHSGHFDDWPGNYPLIGEWSLGNPDESRFKDRSKLKEFAALQMEQYGRAHAGWAFWSWHHDDEKSMLSGWSLRQLLREGIFTIPRVN